jgi:cysteine-rich repeat protein
LYILRNTLSVSLYNGCTMMCRIGPRCGDSIVQASNEACDDGTNLSSYGGCAPGCVQAPRCGDGIRQSRFGEDCDNGPANADGVYNACQTDCELGPRCGDGVRQAGSGEACDDGNRIDFDSCDNRCQPTFG